MEVKTTIEETTATLAVSGKLTVQTSPDLSEAIDKLPSDVAALLIDLAGVDYIASAGLRVLVAADKMMVSRGGSMTLLHPCASVMEVFDMTGLCDIFNIEE